MVIAMLAVLGAACRAGGADTPQAERRAAPAKEPVAPARAERAILIVVDSLRSDALDDASETPTFARIAAEGTSFRARSAAGWCKPAVASILTSLDPERHGATTDVARLSPTVWTLPEVLRCHGFATASFFANGWLSDRFAFDQGWDHHVNYIRQGGRSTADRVLGDALAWIEEHRDERFFAHVHLIDPHTPYDPPAPFAPPDETGMPRPAGTGDYVEQLRTGRRAATEREVRWLRALYRGEVRFVDAQLGAFLGRIDALGLGDSTLVVVTSDHGEALGEEGAFGHGDGSSDDVLDVPLLFRGPSRPEPTDEVVSTRDLAPTLLEALDVEMPIRFEGQSFGPLRRRAPEGPRIEYPPAQVTIDRETCERGGIHYFTGDCDDYPTLAELAAPPGGPLPFAPCAPP